MLGSGRQWLNAALLSIVVTSVSWASTDHLLAHHGEIYPKYPAVHYGTGKHAALVKKGEYLVKLGDCIACHTVNGGKPFAGGRPMPTPFGIFFTPNITPDQITGIGRWTDKQFINSMHNGIRPDGSYNFPVFPYLWFTKITKSDLLAIKAYLDALPPVYSPMKDNQVPFPFSWRFSQFTWRMMAFSPGYFKPDPTKSAAWNRGAYIVEGLGHCGMCHTPVNFLGIPKMEYNLTGSDVSGMLAPNISAAGLQGIKPSEIMKVFYKERLIGGGKVVGPMLEVDRDSLEYVSKKDLHDIAVYLKTVKSTQPPKPSLTGNVGSNVYHAYCYACHDNGAGGAPKFGDKKDWAPRIKKGIKTLYKNAIYGIGAMPAKGTCSSCSNKDIDETVDYMVAALHKPQPKSNAIKMSYAKYLTVAEGGRIYLKHCSVCHQRPNKSKAPLLGNRKAWQQIMQQTFPVIMRHTLDSSFHPKNGGCPTCNTEEVKAAVVYMLKQSTGANYSLWLGRS